MRHGSTFTLLILILCGCGNDDAPAFDPFAKASAPTLPRTFHGHDLAHWLEAVDSTDSATRAEAGWAIGELAASPDPHVDALRTLLDDERPSVRLAALHALQQMGEVPGALSARVLEIWALQPYLAWVRLDALDERWFGPPDPGRLEAHPERAVQLLFLVYLRENHPENSARYVESVRRMAPSVGASAWQTMPHLGPEGIAAALEELRVSPKWAVAEAIAAGLAEVGAVDELRGLLERAAASPRPGMLTLLLRSVERVPAARRAELADLVMPHLSGDARDAAIAAASSMGPDAREALQAFLESDAAARDAAARQIAKLLLLRLERDDG